MWKKECSKAKKAIRDFNGLRDMDDLVRENQLLSARLMFNSVLFVRVVSCIEVFNGGGCLTLAMVWCFALCVSPWDDIIVCASLDVRKFGWVLVQLFRGKKTRFNHWGLIFAMLFFFFHS